MSSNAANPPDEYDDFNDFAEWTPQDFELLDAQLAPLEPQGQPEIEIELDYGLLGVPDMIKPSPSCLRQPIRSKKGVILKADSPLQRFRRTRHLSVTDLVSPAWCEVQFDYGLRQGRHKKLEARPDSFISKSGKEIKVEKKVAASNEVVLQKGKDVHKKLERELRPEEVLVAVATKEEGWALRLLDMISCFRALIIENIAREMPVFGVIEGHIVTGIIDEVLRKEVEPTSSLTSRKRSSRSNPNTPQKPKRSRTMPGPSAIELESSRPTLGSTTSLAAYLTHTSATYSRAQKHFILHINDTKTRRSNTLPSDADALSSRLQLMTYHRLLSDLLSNYDFSLLWKKVQLNPSLKFSQSFISDAGLMVGAYAANIECLDDLTALWFSSLEELNVAHVDARLTLVYRSQEYLRNMRRTEKGKAKEEPAVEVISAQERADIARAIEASLHGFQIESQATSDVHHAHATTANVEEGTSTLPARQNLASTSSNEADSEVSRGLEQSLKPDGTLTESHISKGTAPQNHDARQPLSNGVVAGCPATEALPGSEHDASIIGTKEFLYCASLLDNHLLDIMRWWEGYREPKGVSLEQSWRCSNCEYKDGCEWREKKAREFAEGRRIGEVDKKVVSLGDQPAAASTTNSPSLAFHLHILASGVLRFNIMATEQQAVEDTGPFLHWSFPPGSHVLFSGVSNIWLGCILVIILCLSERFLHFVHDRRWCPEALRRTRFTNALWRTALYWILTLLRFCQMLVVMSFNATLLLLTVTTLAVGQFFIELSRCSSEEDTGPASYSRIDDEEPQAPHPHRTKHRPDGLFIHPNHSNVLRAEAQAAALELGVSRVHRGKAEHPDS
ncbi:hypothetical protein PQX77_001936 [Marasmius sp. AFHP31]|nr:hypothetical protein PQX77_001936 [Marasmius sp. AFHP31]